MDSDTLHTASTYLNNLLLARGLLRNGKALDFAKPTRDTRAQIINLVHDLLLRRDRDQENREQVALTIRTLRTDETRKDAELDRLRSQVGEKERSVVQAQTETRNMKVEMRRMEASVKTLQDQLAKLKASVGHIKTQCTNDIRKRDLHIERLKTHLQGQQRGNKGGVVAPMLNITGGSTGSGRSFNMSVRNIEDPEYSLKQETNEFLTQLSQSLSDENDGLIAMLRGTIQTMKDLLGLDETPQDHDTMYADQGVDLNATLDYGNGESPISYEALATEVESTLEVLRNVLTSADFVSMDEVEQRDEEILRLREGWEMMEARWKEVLTMMNTWRTKMEDGGDTINLDDLKRGLGLGEGLSEGLASPVGPSNPASHQVNNSPRKSGYDQVNEGSDLRSYAGSDQALPTPLPSRVQNSTSKKSSTAIDPPELFHQQPRKERHLRKMSPNIQSPRKVAFAADTAKSSPLYGRDTPVDNNAHARIREASKRELRSQHSAPDLSSPERKVQLSPKRSHIDLFSEPDLDFGDQTSSPILEVADEELTVKEKLRAAQLEAERAASAMQADHLDRHASSQFDIAIDEEIGKLRSPAKKSKIKGRPKRRKSTLSPEELENLMLGSMSLE
ncbi:hypothetical protein AAFC00_003163 [Neodothiora populina]|uniref:NIMA interactive protein n=1 Tax=Neodothiora populina TaxID=2781224 RepID=A0ABR3PA84_9PEZI